MPLSSNERKSYRIYALVDPSTNVAYYVGQTAGTLGYRRLDHVRLNSARLPALCTTDSTEWAYRVGRLA
ncbi:hypothetical protein ABIB56_001325 [Glaciihabitans sp. UYNi722]